MNAESDAQVALVAIGDELLAGKHPDTNSAWTAARLLDLDLTVDRIAVLGDDLEELSEMLQSLAQRYAFVFTTGGLGPTLDDVTRHAAARAAGLELERDEEVYQGLLQWFAERGASMAAANERQALFPRGSEVIVNRYGTAPGFRVALGECWLTCLPGPPRELHGMFDAEVLPWLATRARDSASKIAKATLHMFGVPESQFAESVGSWMDRDENPLMGVTVKEGVLTVVLRARAAKLEAAQALVEARAQELRERFKGRIFSEDDPSLAVALGKELIERGMRIALAESCTGGLVSAKLTSVPGISAALTHGFVTYSNEAKRELLGVRIESLEAHGAVSSAVAREMAAGALAAADAQLAIAITGIAGPDGGSPDKPVGTVWFGIARGTATVAVRRQFPALGRDWVRTLAAQTALDLGRRAAAVPSLEDLA